VAPSQVCSPPSEGAAEDQRAAPSARGIERAPDQLARGGPLEPHAALRRVHRLGDAEPQAPEVLAVGDRPLPVDRHVQPGIAVGELIGHYVRGGERDAVERTCGLRGKSPRLAHAIGGKVPDGGRQLERRHGATPARPQTNVART
jgi:hypothetical protein